MPHFSARITQFSLWGVLPKSGNLKYMIWDASNSNLLFDQIVAAAPLATASLLYSDPFSLTLNGGSTYFFTEITDWDFSDTAYLEKTFKNPNQDK
ncbi:hypothetical protein [Bryobacter aggregatus]|uniref:hypothetical protein n=1 Tax=Bryobacter aggregatus TaxID=360054 RepID=UPI001EE21333|nr:hypothetical protein [Bryobacter aggregatus]